MRSYEVEGTTWKERKSILKRWSTGKSTFETQKQMLRRSDFEELAEKQWPSVWRNHSPQHQSARSLNG